MGEKFLRNNDDKSVEPFLSKTELISNPEHMLLEKLSQGKGNKHIRFVLAVLGSLPWVGVMGAAASFKGESDQDEVNEFAVLWLQEHRVKLHELTETVGDILARLDNFGEKVQERIGSPEYLALVRKAFRSWDQADTAEKRLMFKRLITNAGAITLCPDDQIRLFISWIDRYHEAHFSVMREVYVNKAISKGGIWDNIHSEGRPIDTSAEAGLFSYLMRELNLGGIIHLQRQTNTAGQGMRVKSQRRSSSSSASETLESPFEDRKLWELSELGKEFVRYVNEDVDPQLKDSSSN